MSERTDPSQGKSLMGLGTGNDKKYELLKLQAMGFGELLDTTFSLYRAHLWSFLGVAAIYTVPILIGISALFFDNSAGSIGKFVIWIPTIVVILGASVFVISGLVLMSAEVYLHKRVRIGAMLRPRTRQFLRCFAGSLLFGLLAILTIFFLLLPLAAIDRLIFQDALDFLGPVFLLFITIFVTCWFVSYWYFFAAAVLVEEKSMSNGLDRRGELISGAWWRIVGMMCAILLLHLTIGFICRLAFGFLISLTGLVEMMTFLTTIRWSVLMQLIESQSELSFSYVLMCFVNLGIDVITMPIWVIGSTLLYFDQRIRKEGFDIEMMAISQGE